jgi:hypothetical protein
MRLVDSSFHAGDSLYLSSVQFGDEGLLFGEGVVLAKWQEDSLHIDDDRLFTLLSVAHGREISIAVVEAIERASKHWQAGDKALAAIQLAQIGVRKLNKEGVERLSMAAMLLHSGMPARGARELGLNLKEIARKYDDSEPRVPAGNGRASGQWLSSDSEGTELPLLTGRSSNIHVNHEMPKNAVAVTYPDGSTIVDDKSPTGKLMAPPYADFHKVYNEGTRTFTPIGINSAVGHYGTFDFQRDSVTNTSFDAYKHVSNYAVGVFMAGASYSKWETTMISESFAWGFSSNYERDKSERKYWTTRGWDDAHAGIWK